MHAHQFKRSSLFIGLFAFSLIFFGKISVIKAQYLRWEKHSFGPYTSSSVQKDMAANDVYFDHKHSLLIGGHYGIHDTFNSIPFPNYKRSGIYLTKIDTNGTLKWTIYGGSDNEICEINHIEADTIHHFYYFSGCLTPDGNFINFPASQMPTERNAGFIAKADTNGKIIWVRRFVSYKTVNIGTVITGNINQFAVDKDQNICFTSVVEKGNTLTCGNFSYSPALYNQPYTAKFDSGGNMLWITVDTFNQKRYTASNAGIIQGPNGNYYVLSKCTYLGGVIYDVMIMYSPDGKIIRDFRMRDTFISYGQCTDFKISTDGNVYFAITNYTGNSFTIAMTDSMLNLKWTKKGQGARALKIYINNQSRNIFISGGLASSSVSYQGTSIYSKDDAEIFFKVNRNGQPYWMKYFSGDEDYRAPFCNEEGCGDFYLITQFDYGFQFSNILTVLYPVKLFPNIQNGDDNNKLMTSLIIAKIHFPPLSIQATNEGCGYFNLQNTSDSSITNSKWTYNKKTIGTGQNIDYQFQNKGNQVFTLTGIAAGGCQCTEIDTIHVTFVENPGFNIIDSAGCGFVSVKVTDSSGKDTLVASNLKTRIWNFGDGTIDTIKGVQNYDRHRYYKPGLYIISHIYKNSHCADTASRTYGAVIMQKPAPGIIAAPVSGCAPLDVLITDTGTQYLVSVSYDFGDGAKSASFSPTHTYNTTGRYLIRRTRKSLAGCIVSDSIIIKVLKSLNQADSVNMLAASFIDNEHIVLNWDTLAYASGYEIDKKVGPANSFALYKSVPDNHLLDPIKDLTRKVYYRVRAQDSCGHFSMYSFLAEPVILSGENENDAYFLLRWTPYKQWRNNVYRYEIEVRQPNGSFAAYDQTKDTFSKQESFVDSAKADECYRIKAIELNGNKQISYSNSVCIQYMPMLWIPNAFTPQGDGRNEIFSIQSIGIKECSMDIYNRWGEHLYHSDDLNPTWDGTFNGVPVQEGVYVYIIAAKALNKQTFHRNGTITLLR